MPTLADVVAMLTIASLLSAAFNYVVIRPLQKAIYENSAVLHELRRELDESAKDRRNLDVRLSALEGETSINSERITRLEDRCRELSKNS